MPSQLEVDQKRKRSKTATKHGEGNNKTRQHKPLNPSAQELSPTFAPPVVHSVLHSPGQPLDQATQTSFEKRFKHDFSQVRVHADAQASESAGAVQAQAYTVGEHIAFAQGRYAPQTAAGKVLLGHELAHVVQQSASPETRPVPLGVTNSPAEGQADRAILHLAQPFTHAAFSLQRAGNPPQYQQVAGITTPQAMNVQINPNGTTTQTINGLVVIFERDQTSQAPELRNKAETKFRFENNNINYQASNGRVTSFTGPGQPRVRIRTTYGQGVSASSPSAYGRGTTAADIAAGSTSLGFHEGRHGLDYVAFFQSHTFPTFTGTLGMAETDFQEAINVYLEARRQYLADLEQYSLTQTDCVGTTIDQLNAQEGEVTTMCQATP